MPHRPRPRAAFAALPLLLFAVACSSGSRASNDSNTPGDTGVPRPDSTAAFGWETFGSDESAPGAVETGSLVVPVDYRDPAKGTFDLYVARRLAGKPHTHRRQHNVAASLPTAPTLASTSATHHRLTAVSKGHPGTLSSLPRARPGAPPTAARCATRWWRTLSLPNVQ